MFTTFGAYSVVICGWAAEMPRSPWKHSKGTDLMLRGSTKVIENNEGVGFFPKSMGTFTNLDL